SEESKISEGLEILKPETSKAEKSVSCKDLEKSSDSLKSTAFLKNAEALKPQETSKPQEALRDAASQSHSEPLKPAAVPKVSEKAPEPFEKRRMEQLLREERADYEEAQAVDIHQQNLFEDKLLTVDTVSQIKLAGQIFDTYWIVQYQDNFMIIDQHAAHEKVLYESIIKRLKTQEYTTQQMNPPSIISLTPRQQEQYQEVLPLLTEMGFEIEPFGGNEYAVYGMPDNLVGVTPEALLDEILETAGERGRITPESVYEKAASLACKAAIKGNQRLSKAEAEQLIADLVLLENPYTCPHGRPTMIKMTKYELEKKFKRVL
ncbi:MAG: DNA mismatch repair protein MutL, partial [Lachnospiraceae bacterium]|nr:DNA mismatch repair protein MutL [Lachnospiraceae bacterium]